MRYANNPAAPPSPVTGTGGTSAPFNFMNYQPSASGAASPGAPGIGSNQYQSLPSWMNTSIGSGTQLPSGGSMPTSGQIAAQWGRNLQPIGPEIAPMNPIVSQQINQMMANHVSGTPYNWSSIPSNAQLVGGFQQIPQPQFAPGQLQQQIESAAFNSPALISGLNAWGQQYAQQHPNFMQQLQNPVTPGQGGWSQPIYPPGVPQQPWMGSQIGQSSQNPFVNNLMGGGQASQQLQNMLNQFTGASAQPQMNSIQQQMLQTLFSPQQGYGYGLLGGGQWL